MSIIQPLDIQVPNFIGILQAAQQYRANQARMEFEQSEMARKQQERLLLGNVLSAPEGSPERAAAFQNLQQTAPETAFDLQRTLLGQQNMLLQQQQLRGELEQQPLRTQALQEDITGRQQQNRLGELQISQLPRKAALEEQNIRSEIALRGAQARKLLSEAATSGQTSQIPAVVRAKLTGDIIQDTQQASNLSRILSVPTFTEQFKTLASTKANILEKRASYKPESLSEEDANFLADRRAVFEPLQLIKSELLKEQIGTGRSIAELKSLNKVLAGEETDPITARISIARAADRYEKSARVKALALANGVPESGPEYQRFVLANSKTLNEPPSRELTKTIYDSIISSGKNPDKAEKELERIFPSLKELKKTRISPASPSEPLNAPGFPRGYGNTSVQAPLSPVPGPILLGLLGLPPVNPGAR